MHCDFGLTLFFPDMAEINKKRGKIVDYLAPRRFYCFSDLGGARTLDPLIKSQLLYQLSYEVDCYELSLNCGAKLGTFCELCKFFDNFFSNFFS